MNAELTAPELAALVDRTFGRRPDDRALALLVDLPDAARPDNPDWRARRAMAAAWRDALASSSGLAVRLYQYPNPGSANADLPARAWECPAGETPADDASALDPARGVPFEQVFTEHQILLAPTELSATAPLKVAARRFGFRGATLPGFTAAMIPALRLDYQEVDRRVRRLAGLLTAATGARLAFRVADRPWQLTLDLRHRAAHVSSGLLPEPGTVGNLPSGEAYIVPYEGELPDDPTRSAGRLPVELDGEVVVYRIESNRAVGVEAGGARAAAEAERLAAEPAYGNLAELGLGVLADLGVRPVGSVLLDEKLGLHIAFGRSDHFGGAVGPGDFTSPQAVVHIDRVYLPELQPQVTVEEVVLDTPDGPVRLLERGRYAIEF